MTIQRFAKLLAGRESGTSFVWFIQMRIKSLVVTFEGKSD